MHFAQRTDWEAGENDWARRLRARRASQTSLFDLTVSNPTSCGLGPRDAAWLTPLASMEALHYRPEALGMRSARNAVAAYYADAGTPIPPDHLCLTTSTSEAYSFLFRLLCNPGDEILIARPSYPLFDLLARLHDVTLREYPLFYEPGGTPGQGSVAGGWTLDLHALELAISAKTRAIVVVHPNNPTGNYASATERDALRELAARYSLTLIVDEVFLDYPTVQAAAEPGLTQSFAGESSPCLTFVLSGLSKICAMPQAKLSWLAGSGPSSLVTTALERLEVIADTFLSVSGPSQHALPHWLAGRHVLQAEVQERLRENLATLDRHLAGSATSRLLLQGGWTAILHTPTFVAGVPFAEAALERGAVLQPGPMYGMRANRSVLSLLTPPEILQHGLDLLPIQG